jgi:hypothetical protein
MNDSTPCFKETKGIAVDNVLVLLKTRIDTPPQSYEKKG